MPDDAPEPAFKRLLAEAIQAELVAERAWIAAWDAFPNTGDYIQDFSDFRQGFNAELGEARTAAGAGGE